MAKNTKHHHPEEKVVEALTQTEQLIEKYKKPLLYSVIVIVIIAAASFAYQHLYRKPRINEAMAQTFVAEQYFRADSFALALNGDGNALGFKQILEEYGNNSGEAVNFYAGICELHLGNYQQAIEYLKKYKGEDLIMQARAMCNIGDAHAGLQQNREAVNFYMKAAKHVDTPFAAAYLLKAGIMYEEMGEIDNALKAYEEIKTKYPQTVEGYEIDKYIARIRP
ncbi:MAG: tetratricopeptide repeat protein [Bacteroidales bacterium]|nr:tetratricopeptide repeat protein [Bacteroidales bacterium]MDD2425430.1 tetratricopeptide repeat protein [Bacteroidales bacterium]MDD3988885.1 tetratricopeptide repeat protein [Bacteroidales bacterium]MDD4638434.1 tetratricopeptide repeat protein [Bacteroidales bacterium]